jgi:prepilin-type N-terminal cleavage/methylation domain-containing protein
MRRPAFTLIEILLSLSVIAILAGVLAPVYLSFQTRNDIDIAAGAVTRTLRRAQQLSFNSEGDSAWGMNLASGEVVLFKGASYAARDSAYDEIFSIPTNISFTGTSSVVFSKFYGLPGAATTINLTSVNNETKTININAKGSISY